MLFFFKYVEFCSDRQLNYWQIFLIPQALVLFFVRVNLFVLPLDLECSPSSSAEVKNFF